MTSADEKSLALRKWIFAGLMVAAGVLLSPMFSFPLGVTKAFPLQHMINIFLAVLCGTRYGTAAAFGTSLIRNLLCGSHNYLTGSVNLLFSSRLGNSLEFIKVIYRLFNLFAVLIKIDIIPYEEHINCPNSSAVIFFSAEMTVEP